MNTTANQTDMLLDELALAKKRSEKLKKLLAKGLDIADEASSLEEQVNSLEKRSARLWSRNRTSSRTRASRSVSAKRPPGP